MLKHNWIEIFSVSTLSCSLIILDGCFDFINCDLRVYIIIIHFFITIIAIVWGVDDVFIYSICFNVKVFVKVPIMQVMTLKNAENSNSSISLILPHFTVLPVFTKYGTVPKRAVGEKKPMSFSALE